MQDSVGKARTQVYAKFGGALMAGEKKIAIIAGDIRKEATLNNSETAEAIWQALPLEARGNRWGDEIYFGIPVSAAPENAREVVEAGDLAYWPPGSAFCIFWGPTPASRGAEIRPASPVNVFGKVVAGAGDFSAVRSGTVVRVERVLE